MGLGGLEVLGIMKVVEREVEIRGVSEMWSWVGGVLRSDFWKKLASFLRAFV